MSFLTPCDGCHRHVRSSEARCPFCGAAVSSAMRGRVPRIPQGRLGRAAMMAIGATVATTGCGGASESDSSREQGSGQEPSAGEPSPSESGSTAPGTPANPMLNPAGTSVMPMPAQNPGSPIGEPQGEPMVSADYGVAILEPEPVVGAEPEQLPTGFDAGAPDESEPMLAPKYGAPPLSFD